MTTTCLIALCMACVSDACADLTLAGFAATRRPMHAAAAAIRRAVPAETPTIVHCLQERGPSAHEINVCLSTEPRAVPANVADASVKLRIAALALALLVAALVRPPSLAAPQPEPVADVFPAIPEVRASGGVARVVLHVVLDPVTGYPAFSWNAQLGVAPTIRVRPGETIDMTVYDDMRPFQGRPNNVNVHFHGLMVSPRAPGDDSLTTLARPGEVLHYRVAIPRDHEPGLYWYHPHAHGETYYDVTNGMAGAIVVEGLQQHLPALASMRERIIMLRDVPTGPSFVDPDMPVAMTMDGSTPARRARPAADAERPSRRAHRYPARRAAVLPRRQRCCGAVLRPFGRRRNAAARGARRRTARCLSRDACRPEGHARTRSTRRSCRVRRHGAANANRATLRLRRHGTSRRCEPRRHASAPYESCCGWQCAWAATAVRALTAARRHRASAKLAFRAATAAGCSAYDSVHRRRPQSLDQRACVSHERPARDRGALGYGRRVDDRERDRRGPRLPHPPSPLRRRIDRRRVRRVAHVARHDRRPAATPHPKRAHDPRPSARAH